MLRTLSALFTLSAITATSIAEPPPDAGNPPPPPAAAPKPPDQLTVRPPGLPADRMPDAVDMLRREGSRVLGYISCTDARRFVYALNWLPVIEQRPFYRRTQPREWLSPEQYSMLDDKAKEGIEPVSADGYFFYYTRYGSPVAYARPVELICATLGHGEEGDHLRGKKLVDFGFGGIGHLRLLASIGMNITGIEVDPLLQAMYNQPDDVGLIEGTGMGEKTPDGVLRLLFGKWPAEPQLVTDVGDGYDIFLSKNTLKRGYIHPEPPEGQTVDPRRLINLGVDDATFVREVARILRPGGVWMVYNICPAPAKEGEQYIPWADGRFPFDRTLVEQSGFEVVAWDQDDSTVIRDFARAMYWDEGDDTGQGKIDVEKDLFAHYTLLRRTADAAPATPPPAKENPARQE